MANNNITIPEFDKPSEERYDDIYQLALNSPDGFPDIEERVHYDAGPDPPSTEYIDPSHCEYECDSPHWED